MPDPIPLAALTDEAIGVQLQRLARPELIAYLKAVIACLEAVVDGAEPTAAARDLVARFDNLGEGPLQ